MVRRYQEHLSSMRGWGENWNGYRAPAPREDAIKQVETWLPKIQEMLPAQEWDEPLISSADGDVVVEWYYRSRKYALWFDGDRIDAILVWGTDPQARITDDVVTSLEDVLALWKWLHEES